MEIVTWIGGVSILLCLIVIVLQDRDYTLDDAFEAIISEEFPPLLMESTYSSQEALTTWQEYDSHLKDAYDPIVALFILTNGTRAYLRGWTLADGTREHDISFQTEGRKELVLIYRDEEVQSIVSKPLGAIDLRDSVDRRRDQTDWRTHRRAERILERLLAAIPPPHPVSLAAT